MRLGLGLGLDLIANASSGMRAGIYVNGGNVLYTNQSPYDVEWYGIDTEGVRYPATGFYTQTETLTLDASNPVTINWDPSVNPPDTPVSPDPNLYSKNITVINLTTAPVIVPDKADDSLSFFPSVSGISVATLGDGSTVNVPYTKTFPDEGDEVFDFDYTDPAGNPAVTVQRTWRYAPDIYIVAIDGDYGIYPTYTTEEFQVDVTYIVGAVFGYVNGELGYINGELGWIGSTEFIEPNVAIENGDNELQIANQTDDWNMSKETIPYTLTKAPKFSVYAGDTSRNKEEGGLTYIYPFTIDQGAPYQTTFNYTFVFNDGVYRVYIFGPLGAADGEISYTDGVTSYYPTDINITFSEFSIQLPEETENFSLINGSGASDPVDEIENFTLINGVE